MKLTCNFLIVLFLCNAMESYAFRNFGYYKNGILSLFEETI